MKYFYRLKLIAASVTLLTTTILQAQTKIGGTAGAGDASAVLEVQSSTQGLLLPRLTTTQRDAVVSPATGLAIYNTTTGCEEIYQGSVNGWRNLCSGGGTLSFTNCASPTATGTVNLGSSPTDTITLNYVNNTGQLAGAFQSSTTSGLSLTATGGAVTSITSGSGSIRLIVTGTPTASGSITIPIVLAGASCSVPITVGGCTDPSTTVGATGCITFTYRGSQVVYPTVRAADTHIWIQQNVGAAAVATSATDANGFGDFFQWGRWDDGHQSPTSTVAAASTLSANNPTGLGTGTTTFYTSFWSGGVPSDTWGSSTTASATSGKDPCAAMGAGWHLPSNTEWGTILTAEGITNMTTAFSSHLKIPYQSGYREWNTGNIIQRGSSQGGWYWTGTAYTTNGFGYYVYTGTNNSGVSNNQRGFGFEIRCMK